MEEINLNTSDKHSRKNNLKKIIVIIVCTLVGIFGIINIISIISEPTTPVEKLSISNTTITVEYNEYLGYTAKITGIAKNVSGRSLSYASVEFSVYDNFGNNLGTALANINNLSNGDTWRFEAHLLDYPSTKPASYRIADITAW